MSPRDCRQVMPFSPPTTLAAEGERRHVKSQDPQPSKLLRCFKALKKWTMPMHDKRVTAFHRPLGLRKSTTSSRYHRIYSSTGQSSSGEVIPTGENLLSTRGGSKPPAARALAMVFQKPTPFTMSITTNPSLWHPTSTEKDYPITRISTRRSRKRPLRRPPRGALDEVKEKLRQGGLGRSWGPAATAVHRGARLHRPEILLLDASLALALLHPADRGS